MGCLGENFLISLTGPSHANEAIFLSHQKESQSISDYFQKMKSFFDILATIEESLQCKEFQLYVLNGLDSIYDAIVTAITTGPNAMSLKDLFSQLLNFELRLEQHQSALEATIG